MTQALKKPIQEINEIEERWKEVKNQITSDLL